MLPVSKYKKGQDFLLVLWTVRIPAKFNCVSFQWNVGLFEIDAARNPTIAGERSG
jgi:hypothetical protein